MKDIQFYKQKAIQNEKNQKEKKSLTTKNKNLNLIMTDGEQNIFQNSSKYSTNDLENHKRSTSYNNLGSTYTKLDDLFSEESMNRNLSKNDGKVNISNNRGLNEVSSNLDTNNIHLNNYLNALKYQTHSSQSSADEDFNNEVNNNKVHSNESEQLNNNKYEKIPLHRKISFVIENRSELLNKNSNDKQFYFNFNNVESRGIHILIFKTSKFIDFNAC